MGGLSKESLLSLYRGMLLIRRFEERVAELFARGKLPGFVHLYIGEEAIAVGVCSVLRDDDFITSTHRGHGHLIAKGGDVAKMMAEIYGKSTGYCKGKGGSLHITDVSVGMLGANGIVCGGVPIAVGAAYGSAKIRGTDQVAVAFFGDGATSEGAFHEACNMASAWKLPVIFVCENNLYGVGTRLGRVAPTEDLIARASGYGMPAVSVDGNDVIAVREAAKEALARAREGGGPSFLECKTWRHRAHFEGEDTSLYRNEDEHQSWLAKDPVKRFARRLLESETVTQEELDELNDAVQAEINEAVKFSEESPDPAPEDALEDLYV
ncbi:MAG: thiamine pyrophosphate-dependent dehydrogenase E1 component subunit alpha [Anaerolineae bacterium]